MSIPRDQPVYYRRSRFTTHLPIDRRYSPAHYWLLEESAGVWRVGFTKFATRMLGDIVEFEFGVPVGADIAVGDEIGSIEGLKAVTSVFAAGAGRFLGEGAFLRQDVTLAESEPYAGGWLYRLEGEPAPDTVDVHGYVAILDATIDKMLASRHAGAGNHDEE
ncbi:MAG: glycine cleavage system protein H [Luteitalea sp.]|nr:glycine cleavage system protein H [Luteitalea sp.]